MNSTFKIEKEIEVVCESCGEELNTDYDERKDRIKVSPCQSCLDGAYEGGNEDGYTAGRDAAYEEIEEAKDVQSTQETH